MSDRLLIGTRKGLFRIQRNDGDWRITDTWFLGDPVSMILRERGSDRLHVALDLGHFGVKLRRSDNDGANWDDAPVPSYPEKPAGLVDRDPMRDIEIPWDTKLIWSLAEGEPGELWCGTIPGGLFRSTDSGENWTLCESLWGDERRRKWVGGGYDFAGIHSIMVDPRDSAHVTVGVSVGGVWTTRDRGESWALIGAGQRNEYMPPDLAGDPLGQDPHRIAQCPADPDRLWLQHHNGIFRSDDGGANFAEITTASPSAFGFAVVVHPDNPNRVWFVPAQKDEQRIPVDAKLLVMHTSDGGESFETFDAGLPTGPSYDLIYRHALTIDDAGERLAFGSTTGSLWVSESQGRDWQAISHHLPPINCVLFDR